MPTITLYLPEFLIPLFFGIVGFVIIKSLIELIP